MFNNILLVILCVLLPTHDFHISHTTIHYNDQLDNIEITLKVPIEDIENSIETKNSEKLKIGTTNESNLTNDKIQYYINNRLKVFINDDIFKYKWIGKELDEDLYNLYLYFEITNCKKNGIIQSIAIENTLFIDNETNQTNIVLIEFEDKNYNLTLSKDHIYQKIFLE